MFIANNKPFPVIISLFALVLLLLPSQARALATDWVEGPHADVRLVTALDGSLSTPLLYGGLEIRMQPGWYAYWRTPGEGGLPPRLDWDASENLVYVQPMWPVPERIEFMGMYSFGYRDHLMLPLSIAVNETDKPAVIRLDADIMVCNQICVPQHFELSLILPPDPPELSAEAPLISAMESRIPHCGDRPGLRIDSVVLGPDAVVVRAFSSRGYDDADLFVEVEGRPDIILAAPPEITPDGGDGRHATLRVAAPVNSENLAAKLMDQTLVLTLTTPRGTIERTISFDEESSL